ncbi:hypothetical protein BDK51DRAFT_37624 [Blyttiomyces helicus]|uniref:Uncharacterized protein n=1 Tax=Blyttiomyces helicus TaxID=388810 RepID=A0A4P9WGA5_9FUNG|nr:hypothetical protein BDK51DRAFT_37624 [Blyttiomyces helicus]|eukprot:RKO91841.1 hypothetical protein BDK51DRAFT_37624 [Blyttiomyces helicus]
MDEELDPSGSCLPPRRNIRIRRKMAFYMNADQVIPAFHPNHYIADRTHSSVGWQAGVMNEQRASMSGMSDAGSVPFHCGEVSLAPRDGAENNGRPGNGVHDGVVWKRGRDTRLGGMAGFASLRGNMIPRSHAIGSTVFLASPRLEWWVSLGSGGHRVQIHGGGWAAQTGGYCAGERERKGEESWRGWIPPQRCFMWAPSELHIELRCLGSCTMPLSPRSRGAATASNYEQQGFFRKRGVPATGPPQALYKAVL